jgi:hypothetical protein
MAVLTVDLASTPLPSPNPTSLASLPSVLATMSKVETLWRGWVPSRLHITNDWRVGPLQLFVVLQLIDLGLCYLVKQYATALTRLHTLEMSKSVVAATTPDTEKVTIDEPGAKPTRTETVWEKWSSLDGVVQFIRAVISTPDP